MIDFREESSSLEIQSRMNAYLLSDPNIDHGKFEKAIDASFDKHFPDKNV